MTKAGLFAGRRGISMIVVVILVILTIAMVTVSFVLYFRWIDYERIQKKLVQDIKHEVEAKDALVPMIRGEVAPTGMFQTPPEPKDLTEAPAKNVYEKKLSELLGGDTTAITKAKEAKIFPTLQSLVEVAASNMYIQFDRMKNLELELVIAKSHATVRENIAPEMPKRKNEFIQQMQERIARLNQLIAEENNQYNTRKTEFDTMLTTATTASEEETQAFYNWEIRIKNEIRELQRQLEELKVKEIIKLETSFSHGKILRPDVENRVAFIDLGSRERVVTGLKFLVAKRGDQGRFVYKAEIEVKKVWMTYSEVVIHRVYSREVPVIDGDLIVNPLFSKYRPVVVAFAGEEKPLRIRPALSIDEATRRITEMGSVVKKEPDLDVDFVIWTEAGSAGGAPKQPNMYKEFAKAQLLEIPITDASEIYRFIKHANE